MTEDYLSFKDRVILVTGAGGGLGREYALEYGRRGAKVVVNDLGVTVTGDSDNASAADTVVAEIEAQGGTAFANKDSVENGEAIVAAALEKYDRLDVVINNAGVLRDKSFAKMTFEDWDLVYRVHVEGAYKVTKAAWPHMVEQGYGRFIFTASAAGLFGNFGQANYGTMKSALMGMMRTLAIEGQGKGILSNAIAPVAGSRMTETILDQEHLNCIKPEFVMPLVVALTHENNQENGSVFEVGGGWMAKLRWNRTEGIAFSPQEGFSAEDVFGQWDKLCDFGSGSDYPEKIQDTFAVVFEKAGYKG